MSDDFIIDQHEIEFTQKTHKTIQNDLQLKWYYLSPAEIWALVLTFLYYILMICFGVICWLNARRRYKNRHKSTNVISWSRFHISPNQLHIKYTNDDGDSMGS
ncbi:unnamed protein product [Heterobilharzia americana]|nr:unnamed protein product [Heterobilharzia americana]CAH8611367.1 unnamed protein product [Heterobilharzia americana]